MQSFHKMKPVLGQSRTHQLISALNQRQEVFGVFERDPIGLEYDLLPQ